MIYFLHTLQLTALSVLYISHPLFFMMLRRSQSLTLFPYTTLFRSYQPDQRESGCACRRFPDKRAVLWSRHPAARSEEHTSELQSPCNLVCRLLLEKKNQAI